MRPACTRPGGGSYDETAEPKAKGKDKTKSKAIAKVQASSSSSSADPSGGGATSSGGASGADVLDIKAMKEVQELLKSMKLARLHVSFNLGDSAPGESVRQVVESIRRVAVGEMGLLDGGATACMRMAKAHERNLNYPTVKVSLALGESHLMMSPEGTLLSVEKVSPIVSYTALRKLGYRILCDEDTLGCDS